MARVRAALYLDFDNVFSGLIKQDPDVAIQFAKDPAAWLVRLTTSLTVDGPRRWLILRCYMNPGGWVPNPDSEAAQPRLYYSQFRPFFVNAGFEVIDCPRLTTPRTRPTSGWWSTPSTPSPTRSRSRSSSSPPAIPT
ncbi:hypothetical protein [Actinoplanes sp. HUAS TT8]|uniref:hypothetical protein n=1 Tax=Actinoplanes sp. HUAS TT8 TaxID=3447453 RepID=UPI003F524010